MVKKATKGAKNEEALVHARIPNPIFVRKTLLESAILGAEVLKGYERIKSLEIKKTDYRNQVKKIIIELNSLVAELENDRLPKMPHIEKPRRDVKIQIVEKEIKEREYVRGEIVKRPNKFIRTHTEVLDEEIRRLQERINKL